MRVADKMEPQCERKSEELTQVGQAISKLCTSVHCSEELSERLEDRVSLVLRGHEPSDEACDPKPVDQKVALAQDLESLADRIIRNNGKIADIMERVEL